MADVASRADQVAGLVAALKAGEITKDEMFARLSKISSGMPAAAQDSEHVGAPQQASAGEDAKVCPAPRSASNYRSAR